MAQQPLDSYGFALDWYTYPNTANEVLSPPVLPAWWAVGIRLFGDQPVLWKLWLFPFTWLFVTALHDLFRRFSHGNTLLMTWTVTLSPVFLPSLNLMLDIPALALGLSALRLFFIATERHSYLLASLAGLMAGLAMETKYTSFLIPVVMLLHAVLHRRYALWLAAAGGAAAVFACFECWTARLYGESHFLHALREGGDASKFTLLFPFVALLGGVGGPLLLMALAALRRGSKLLLPAAALLAAPYAVMVLLPEERRVDLPLPEFLIFFTLGWLVLAAVTIAVCRLCRPWRWRLRRIGRPADFLLLWLLVEVAGYFALTPFPAVRRLMGFEIVAMLLIARLVAISCRKMPLAGPLRFSAGFTVLLGVFFWAVDLREAWAQKEGAERAVQRVLENDPSARIWYAGHWGFQYHMDQLGGQPVIPDYPPRPSYVPLPDATVFHKNDWLIWPDDWINHQAIALDMNKLQEMDTVVVDDPIPWRTVIYFYGSRTGVPIRHHRGPRLRIKIYRVLEEFPAAAGWQ